MTSTQEINEDVVGRVEESDDDMLGIPKRITVQCEEVFQLDLEDLSKFLSVTLEAAELQMYVKDTGQIYLYATLNNGELGTLVLEPHTVIKITGKTNWFDHLPLRAKEMAEEGVHLFIRPNYDEGTGWNGATIIARYTRFVAVPEVTATPVTVQ